jgi:hypothetical protein
MAKLTPMEFVQNAILDCKCPIFARTARIGGFLKWGAIGCSDRCRHKEMLIELIVNEFYRVDIKRRLAVNRVTVMEIA